MSLELYNIASLHQALHATKGDKNPPVQTLHTFLFYFLRKNERKREKQKATHLCLWKF